MHVNRMSRFSPYVVVPLVVFAILSRMAVVAHAEDSERRIGADVYRELQAKGEIIDQSSPLYTALRPTARRIANVANHQYEYPFRFVLVRQKQPNAFAVPGGNVYISDSLMRFVRYREALAAVLCHETAHTIHHDVTNLIRKNQNTNLAARALAILLGSKSGSLTDYGIGVLANLQSLSFSRDVERTADLKGADTCAEANSNPWGLVKLIEAFGKSNAGGKLEMLSDHPRDDHRISDLEAHFRNHPERFTRFKRDSAWSTPLNIARR